MEEKNEFPNGLGVLGVLGGKIGPKLMTTITSSSSIAPRSQPMTTNISFFSSIALLFAARHNHLYEFPNSAFSASSAVNGMEHVRETIPFPRTLHRLYP